MEIDCADQPVLDLLVVAAHRRLEGRDDVAHHVLGRIVEERIEPRLGTGRGVLRREDLEHQDRMLRDRERIVALGLPIPARHSRQPVRDIAELDVERRGIEDSSRRPLSIRCQALVEDFGMSAPDDHEA